MHLDTGNFHILIEGHTPVISIETRSDGSLVEIQDKYNTGKNIIKRFRDDVMEYIEKFNLENAREAIEMNFDY